MATEQKPEDQRTLGDVIEGLNDRLDDLKDALERVERGLLSAIDGIEHDIRATKDDLERDIKDETYDREREDTALGSRIDDVERGL